MSEPITCRLERSVLWIGLNRPERYNAYNLAMRDALYEAFGLKTDLYGYRYWRAPPVGE